MSTGLVGALRESRFGRWLWRLSRNGPARVVFDRTKALVIGLDQHRSRRRAENRAHDARQQAVLDRYRQSLK